MAERLPGLGRFGPPDRARGVSRCWAPGSASGWRPASAALLAVVALLAVNWFGDSLDGTLARVRHQERPRYGFYVDHVLDVVGILLLFAGLVAGGFMTPIIGAGFLIAYYLLTVEIALATHAVGTFRISFWKIGPTEMRILLAVGTLQLLRSPDVVDLRQPAPALRRRRRDWHRRALRDVRRLGGLEHADAVSAGAAAAAAGGTQRTESAPLPPAHSIARSILNP